MSNRIIFIAPKFYGYEEYIIKELNKLNYKVDYIPENIDGINFFYRFLFRYFKKYKNTIFNIFFNKKIKNIIKNEYDLLFVIRGAYLRDYHINRLSKPNVQKILYQWDSVQNNKNAIEIAPLFDKVFTFDRNDAEKFGWIYRPLFFINELCKYNNSKKYDFAYIGTIHSKRIDILKNLLSQNIHKNFNCFFYLYATKWSYIYNLIIKKNKELFDLRQYIKTKPLTIKDTYNIYSQTKIVIDYTNEKQNGLTMRTIEAIGNQTKLVTNNSKILKEEIFDKANITIYSNTDIIIPENLSEDPKIKDTKKYSLNSWVNEIIGL